MYTENIKKNIMKWRDNNKEEYNEYMTEYKKKSVKYNERQKAIMRAKYEIINYKDYGNYEKISKTFRNILI